MYPKSQFKAKTCPYKHGKTCSIHHLFLIRQRQDNYNQNYKGVIKQRVRINKVLREGKDARGWKGTDGIGKLSEEMCGVASVGNGIASHGHV